jgi:hypothetical protein
MMGDELTPEQKFAGEDAETMVPRALMLGRSPEEVVADLVALDWSPEAARALVARAAEDLKRFQESPESRRQLLGEARNQMVGGCLLGLIGAGLTASTFLFALAGAPFFIVAFGLLLGGLVLAGRGWGRWRFYRLSVRVKHSERSEEGRSNPSAS